MKFPQFLTKILLLSTVFSSTASFGQGAITFDGAPVVPPGSDIGVRQYSEQGMLFYAIGAGGQFGHTGGGVSFFPDDGSAYIHTASGESIAFNVGNGSTFGVVSADLAEYSTVFPSQVTITFTGYHADGSIISTSFTTDGIIDGTGALADFQTFNFGPGWTDLQRVEISPDGWSLDNLVFTVPEPRSSAFVLLALLVFQIGKMKKGNRDRWHAIKPGHK